MFNQIEIPNIAYCFMATFELNLFPNSNIILKKIISSLIHLRFLLKPLKEDLGSRILILVLIMISINNFSMGQVDSLTLADNLEIEKTRKRNNLPYFMDDLMIIGGINRSGLYFSDNFRDLSYGSGFQIGAEGFLPLGNITFIDFGIHYAQRNFLHNINDIKFKNHFVEVPIYVSFSLPELTRIDWRFFLGTQITYRISSSQSASYDIVLPEIFNFDPERFKRLDGGMTFGLSGEVKDVYLRLRSYVGVNNLDRNDQGAMNAFYIEVGYFLFRKYRK